MLNGKTILVTGGTGSFGKTFIKSVFDKYPLVKKIIVFSRDELKQFEMRSEFSFEQLEKLRFFIGDIRDLNRLERAFEGVDIVVHAAALKQVPAAEYNPMECIKTNILGAENVINAALSSNIKKIVALSTDKAAAPINLYGATKLCSDKLFIAADNIKGIRDLTISVVRYGNVMGSRGSVIPLFLKQKLSGEITVTNKEMTRFNITLQEGIEMVIYALENSIGGEIFIPKIPSYRIMDIVSAIAPECTINEIGIRPGEKLHEEMITETDSLNTLDCGKYYVILPGKEQKALDKLITSYIDKFNAKPVPKGFQYSSGKNEEWLSIQEIKNLIREHVLQNIQ